MHTGFWPVLCVRPFLVLSCWNHVLKKESSHIHWWWHSLLAVYTHSRSPLWLIKPECSPPPFLFFRSTALCRSKPLNIEKLAVVLQQAHLMAIYDTATVTATQGCCGLRILKCWPCLMGLPYCSTLKLLHHRVKTAKHPCLKRFCAQLLIIFRVSEMNLIFTYCWGNLSLCFNTYWGSPWLFKQFRIPHVFRFDI